MSGTKDYEVGYKKPPKHTRFGAGNNANPQGKTSEQKKLEMENAEAATRIRQRLLSAVEAVLVEKSSDEALELVEAAMLKLLKDSEDRGLGTPLQKVDNTTNGKDMPAPFTGFDIRRASADQSDTD